MNVPSQSESSRFIVDFQGHSVQSCAPAPGNGALISCREADGFPIAGLHIVLGCRKVPQIVRVGIYTQHFRIVLAESIHPTGEHPFPSHCRNRSHRRKSFYLQSPPLSSSFRGPFRVFRRAFLRFHNRKSACPAIHRSSPAFGFLQSDQSHQRCTLPIHRPPFFRKL